MRKISNNAKENLAFVGGVAAGLTAGFVTYPVLVGKGFIGLCGLGVSKITAISLTACTAIGATHVADTVVKSSVNAYNNIVDKYNSEHYQPTIEDARTEEELESSIAEFKAISDDFEEAVALAKARIRKNSVA